MPPASPAPPCWAQLPQELLGRMLDNLEDWDR